MLETGWQGQCGNNSQGVSSSKHLTGVLIKLLFMNRTKIEEVIKL
jgi:hypothetical protein